NPTGGWLKRDERAALTELCATHGLALIGDEVFAAYPIDSAPALQASVVEHGDVLTFSLGGLSKSVGLPQVKLGWIAASGPSLQLRAALTRLELIADTYLSVGTPVQMAAAHLLNAGASVRDQIRRRVLENYRALTELATACNACQVLRAEGGWTAVVRTPHTMPEEERTIRLLEDHHVLVHPGYFFDFPHDGYVVVSLLPRPDIFRAAAARLF